MREQEGFTGNEFDLFQLAVAHLCLDGRCFFLDLLLLLRLVAATVGDGRHRAVLVFRDGLEKVAGRVFVGLDAQIDGGRLVLEEGVEINLERTADVHCCGLVGRGAH